jgi:signal transduction histidine kinase
MSSSPQPQILIVDDNAPAVEMLQRLLSGNGYEVLKAYSGLQALELAEERIPDLILLDVMMPGMSGHDVISQLKRNPKTADIPIIFITAKDTPADIEEGFGLGAVDYIPKPAEPRELLARARSKIEAKRLRDELTRRNSELEALLNISNLLNASLEISKVLEIIIHQFGALYPLLQVTTFYMQQNSHEIIYFPLHAGLSNRQVTELAAAFTHSDVISTPHRNELPPMTVFALRIDGTVRGAICVTSTEELDDSQRLLIENVAKQASLALRNAELFGLRAHYAQELERTVAERTTELVSAQKLLIRSEKLASVGRLASAIAHEINNPLTPVVLNLELMVEDVQANREINFNEIDILATYRSAQRIRRILERVLQFTRNGRENKPAMDYVDLAAILYNIISLSKHYFVQNKIRLDVDIPETLPPVLGNSDQLEQVFLNIMLNAKDAMELGGTLAIRTIEDADTVAVSFVDTGKGIEPEIMDTLFEPFTSTKEENGSGLGLFVSYEIINNHHGAITVESTPQKGTIFTVTLPKSGS